MAPRINQSKNAMFFRRLLDWNYVEIRGENIPYRHLFNHSLILKEFVKADPRGAGTLYDRACDWVKYAGSDGDEGDLISGVAIRIGMEFLNQYSENDPTGRVSHMRSELSEMVREINSKGVPFDVDI